MTPHPMRAPTTHRIHSVLRSHAHGTGIHVRRALPLQTTAAYALRQRGGAAGGTGARRLLATVRDENRSLSGVWFTSRAPGGTGSSLEAGTDRDENGGGYGDRIQNPKGRDNGFATVVKSSFGDGPDTSNSEKPPDERTLKLGKTIRTLHARLPTLLASPLPASVLSPHISLHLFPSTHPHLPTVSGRIAYNAALWTAPVAWGRVPVVGNVHLIILSERMVRASGEGGLHATPATAKDGGGERLIVKWKTCTSPSSPSSGLLDTLKGYAFSESSGPSNPPPLPHSLRPTTPLKSTPSPLPQQKTSKDSKEFTGLFIFSFDADGRILTHTIEHARQSGDWDWEGTRVVNVTEWLLGRVGRGREREADVEVALGFCGGGDGVEEGVGRRFDGRGE